MGYEEVDCFCNVRAWLAGLPAGAARSRHHAPLGGAPARRSGHSTRQGDNGRRQLPALRRQEHPYDEEAAVGCGCFFIPYTNYPQPCMLAAGDNHIALNLSISQLTPAVIAEHELTHSTSLQKLQNK